jgi:hypothetical protein
MKDLASKFEALAAQHRLLEATCQLWIAANEAKDGRIQELEAECNHLRQKAARLVRQVGRRQKVSTPGQVRYAR